MLYIGHHMHIIFYLHLVVILEILSNSRTQGESWRFHIFFIFEFFSNIEKMIILVLIIFLSKYFKYQNIWEEIKWLLQTKRNTGGKILKSNNYFIWILFEILFELENMHFFKIALLGQKNVHFILNILFRRWKLFLAFLDFF